jgi:drug/metabolite transporter (DMT)-like permease
MTPRTITALFVTMILWSSAFAALRKVTKVYDPGSLALLRFLVASIALGLFAAYKRMRMPEPADLPRILLVGLLGISGYHILLNAAMKATIDSGTAAFLICTSPVFTALIARFYLKERLRIGGWSGILLSLCGVLLISLGKSGSTLHFDLNALLVLGSAFFASVYTVVQKPFLNKKYSALEFTTYVIWAGTLCMLVFVPHAFEQLKTAPLSETLLVVYLGVFPAAIAYVTWTYVLANMPVSRAVSFLYLQPPLATLIGWFALDERPHIITLVGGILALAGVVVVNRWGRAAESVTPTVALSNAAE